MNVVAFKLNTGEEIISRVVKYVAENNTVILDRPRAIQLIAGRGSDQVGMTLVPFMLANQDGEVTLNRNHVVAETNPPKQLEDGYVANTSSIQL